MLRAKDIANSVKAAAARKTMSTETEKKPEVAVRCTGMVGDEQQARSIDLGKSQITPNIRVSSAALLRDDWWGSWWLVETWIFSDDPRQKNRQIIHGTCSAVGGGPPHERVCATASKVHGQIADNLRRRFADVEPDREGGGGGGSENLPPAEEKYNAKLCDMAADKPKDSNAKSDSK